MKKIATIIQCLWVLTIAVLLASCAADEHNKESMAAAAGFKVITPNGADQQALLAKLPPRQVTQITYKGKMYYVLPNAAKNQAYVGGPKAYQSYQQLRLQQQMSNDNLMAAQMNETAAMNWGAWGGWGMYGPMY